MKNETTLTVRLPKALKDKLEVITKETERSAGYYVRKALIEYLEDLEDYSIAQKRLSQKDIKYLTTEEVKEKLRIR